MSKIFISHSSANNALALAIGRWLADNGWDEYFLDLEPVRGLAPGERWQEALKAAADRCEAVLFLISPAWRDSHWCLAEFLLAKQLGKTIFGVLVEAVPLDALPKEMTVEWQRCDLVAGTRRQSFRVSHDPLVPDTEVSFAEAGLSRLKLGLQRAGLDPSSFPWPPPNDPKRLPYPGLRALESEDAAVFFGREAAIVRGLDTLRSVREQGIERVFVILGASGAGKSSFLRAGLWPRLKRDDRNFLPLPVIRPERAVLTGATGLVVSLEQAFREFGSLKARAEIRHAIQAPESFKRLLGELQAQSRSRLGSDSAVPTLLLCIDQSEELFGTDGREETLHFLSLLGKTLTTAETCGIKTIEQRARTLAVVAIRTDAYERLQTTPSMSGISLRVFSLPPIERAEFKAVIEGPAALSTVAGSKLTIQPVLTERLLQEAKGADALPLLAFTLERLFINYGGAGTLRAADYEALGGVRGSIEAAVEASFVDPSREPAVPSDKAERERLLRESFIPWLARVDPKTDERKRRVARWDELPESSHAVLERLIRQRLLLRDRRKVASSNEEVTVVEVAHEALLRQWPTLTAWLDKDAEALKTIDTVQRAAHEWRKNKNGAAWLAHSGERLMSAEALRQREDLKRLLGEDGFCYLQACRERDERLSQEKAERDRLEREAREARLRSLEAEAALQKSAAEGAEREKLQVEEEKRKAEAFAIASRRKSWIAIAGAMFALVCALIAGVFAWQTMLAKHQSVASEVARSAEDLARDHPDQSLLLAMAAWNINPISRAEATIRRARSNYTYKHVLRGHEAVVNGLKFSPDGKTLVTTSEDTTARLWDAQSGKEMKVLRGHEDEVTSAQFSLDGKTLVTTSRDRTTRVWEAQSGRQLKVLRGHDDQVFDAQFSPDGMTLATTGGDGTARLWDVRSGSELQVLLGHEDAVYDARFSPDGNTLATTSEDKTVRLWDVQSGLELQVLSEHEAVVNGVQFSPDGKTLATGGGDGTARLWDAQSGQQLQVLSGHDGSVNDAQFSPDGKTLATTSWDKTARLWDVQTGATMEVLRGHQAAVNRVQFSHDGKTLVTTSEDKTARIWNAERGRELQVLRGHEAAVGRVQFSPDDKTLATTSEDTTARLWDAYRGRERQTLRVHQARVTAVQFSSDGKTLTTTSSDNTARLWEAQSGKELQVLGGRKGHVNDVQFSHDGKTLATAGEDKTARLWDAETGIELQVLRGHERGLSRVQFSPDGKSLATTSEDKTARLWDAHTGKTLQVILGHETAFNYVQFSPDGKTLATTSYDKTARLWSAQSGKELHVLRGHQAIVNDLQFSPDGKTLTTTSKDKTARVWDAQSGKELQVLRGHEAAVNDLQFSPDGKTLATTSEDYTARLWDAHSGKELQVLRGHEGAVNDVQFSPDGKTLATAGEDKTARLWDAETGIELQVLRGHEGGLSRVQFSPDGKTLATATSIVRLWNCDVCGPISEIIDSFSGTVGRQLTEDERRRFGVPE